MTAIGVSQVRLGHETADGEAVRAGTARGTSRDFRMVLFGQGVSAVGDAVSATTVPLLVLALTGSGLMMGFVAALQRIPDVVLALPAGALADRWDRRRAMLIADAGRAALTAAVPLAALGGIPVLPVLLLVLLPINALRVLFSAAWTATVPTLAGRDNLGRATGLMSAMSGASFVIGPAIAGILVVWIGPAPTLALDAASFAVSALTLRFVTRSLRPQAPAVTGVGRDVAEGVRFVLGHAVLRDAIAFSSLVSIVAAPVVPALSFFLTSDRGLGAEAFGFAMSAYGLGMLVGAVVGGRRMTGSLRHPLLAGTFAGGIATVGMAAAAATPAVLAAAFASGVAMAVVVVASATVRAAVAPDRLLGRVNGTTRAVAGALHPVSFVVGGVLLDTVGGGGTLAVIGGLSAAIAVAFTRSSGLRGAHARPHALAGAAS